MINLLHGDCIEEMSKIRSIDKIKAEELLETMKVIHAWAKSDKMSTENRSTVMNTIKLRTGIAISKYYSK